MSAVAPDAEPATRIVDDAFARPASVITEEQLAAEERDIIAADPLAKEEIPEAPETPTPEAIAELEDVQSQAEPRVWIVEGDLLFRRGNQEIIEHRRFEYVQEPLSYQGMVQFTGLLGRKLDEAMSGSDPISIGAVVDIAQIAQAASSGSLADQSAAMFGEALQNGELNGIDAFLKGFAKLVSYAPDIMDEAQAIWLRIPLRDRLLVRELWSYAPGKGGLSGDEGEEMFKLFIAQNFSELERFFVERLNRIGQTIQTERKRADRARLTV